MDQLGQWLSHHRLPGDQISGLNDRCWTRASANRDLALALSDCNHALGPDYDDAAIRDSRGLVYLRLNRLEDAMADYNFALHANPDMPTSLYGRGLTELRLGETAQGQADIDAAKKLDKGIAKEFTDMGLEP